MRRNVYLVMLVSICMMPLNAWALTDRYAFEDPAQAQTFNRILNSLRCMVCQNQSLAESDAPLAQDMRALIYAELQQHRSEADIRMYLTKRYGAYIDYQPPMTAATIVLWSFPFVLLCTVLGVLYTRTRLRGGRDV